MTSFIFRVRIDDIDRDQDPDLPWTATLVDEDDHVTAAGGGVGRSPRDALISLVDEFIEVTA